MYRPYMALTVPSTQVRAADSHVLDEIRWIYREATHTCKRRPRTRTKTVLYAPHGVSSVTAPLTVSPVRRGVILQAVQPKLYINVHPPRSGGFRYTGQTISFIMRGELMMFAYSAIISYVELLVQRKRTISYTISSTIRTAL